MAKGKLTLIDHTADTGIDVQADSLEELLQTAAQGLILVSFGKTEPGRGKRTVAEFHEESFEDLVVELLRQMVLKIETEGVRLYDAVVTEADMTGCTAYIYEAPLSSEEEIETHIKAVTYHRLSLKKQGDMYHIKIIFDI